MLLAISVILLNIIFISRPEGASFLALYYIVWLFGVGTFFLKRQDRITQKLVAWKAGRFVKFMCLGLCMIVLEEIFAGISMHLAVAKSLTDILAGIVQFWAFNLLALPGFILGWYLLLRYIEYSRKEVFLLVGLFGLFSEKTLLHVMSMPVMGLLLVLPTMFTYMLIIAPSVVSFEPGSQRRLPRLLRYPLGLLFPIATSIPFVTLLIYLKQTYPDRFPPAGFVG